MGLSAAQKRKANDDKARQVEDSDVLYHAWLDENWPGWQEHKDGRLYSMLRQAFHAGAASALMSDA